MCECSTAYPSHRAMRATASRISVDGPRVGKRIETGGHETDRVDAGGRRQRRLFQHLLGKLKLSEVNAETSA